LAVTKGTRYIAPNFGREFIISLPPSIAASANIRVLDMNGTVIEHIERGQPTKWNAYDFPSGMYIIAITSNGQSFFEKVLVY
jgi:hypothetical protein